MQRSRDEMSTEIHKAEFKHISFGEDYFTIHVHPGYDYDIEFERARSCGYVCMWLGQILEKTWCSKELLGEMVMAFSIINDDLRGIK